MDIKGDYVDYTIFPRGPAKIQLLPQEVMFRPGGFWHARDEKEFIASIASNEKDIRHLCQDKNISPQVQEHLNSLLKVASSGGNPNREAIKTAIGYLNSMTFRAGGSSTVKRTTWKRAKDEKGVAIVSKDAIRVMPELSNYALARVSLRLGDDLYTRLRNAAVLSTTSVLDEINKQTASTESRPQIWTPNAGKSLTKVDFKLMSDSKGEINAALIDINAGIIATHLYDKQLEEAGLEPGIVKEFADAILFIHNQETKKPPAKIVISVKDPNLLKTHDLEISALQTALQNAANKLNAGGVEIGVALASDIKRGVKSCINFKRPFGIRLVGKGTMTSPDLIVNFGRFDSLDDETELKNLGTNVVDKAKYALMSDKTLNGKVFDLIKYKLKRARIIVPRRVMANNNLFESDYLSDIERAVAIAKVEGWKGVVVKLPVKISISGSDVTNAYFFNPNSPIQIEAVKDAIKRLREKGSLQLSPTQQRRAVLNFEELITGGLPELGGRSLEVRTLVFPKRGHVTSWQRLFVPNETH
ncbi:hypothetical protein HUU53_01915 [Candidatus Micrarchaeota archaeon]|nr:hypothetical protein [Candidatus Micrarchaeota archaeon]